MAERDEIVAWADEYLDLASYPDYGPMGLQVVGAPEVRKLVCGVSASRELFERAAEADAQMVLVHHGLFWEKDPRRIGAVMRERLRALFDADLTSSRTTSPSTRTRRSGTTRPLRRARDRARGAVRRRLRLRRPASRPDPGQPARRAGAGAAGANAARLLLRAGAGRAGRRVLRRRGTLPRGGLRRGLRLLPDRRGRRADQARREGRGVHFIAGGHYATETLGVRALSARIGERFDIAWDFVDLPNPV